MNPRERIKELVKQSKSKLTELGRKSPLDKYLEWIAEITLKLEELADKHWSVEAETPESLRKWCVDAMIEKVSRDGQKPDMLDFVTACMYLEEYINGNPPKTWYDTASREELIELYGQLEAYLSVLPDISGSGHYHRVINLVEDFIRERYPDALKVVENKVKPKVSERGWVSDEKGRWKEIDDEPIKLIETLQDSQYDQIVERLQQDFKMEKKVKFCSEVEYENTEAGEGIEAVAGMTFTNINDFPVMVYPPANSDFEAFEIPPRETVDLQKIPEGSRITNGETWTDKQKR